MVSSPAAQIQASNRCARCSLWATDCRCALVQQFETKAQLALLLHRRDLGNPSASEALVLSAFPDCGLFVHGQKDQPIDLGPLYERERRVLLLYPSERARPLSAELLAEDPRPVTLVVPGGSWRKAGRAARRIPSAARAEHVRLTDDRTLAKNSDPSSVEALSTFEAVARALGILEGESVRRELEAVWAERLHTVRPRKETTAALQTRGASVVTQRPLDVLHLDEWLVAVDKPSGYLVHRGWGDEGPILLQALRDQLGRTLYPVHRLDRQTSGALLFAFYPEVARDLQTALEEQRIQKSYLALCRGNDPTLTRIEHPLTKEPGKGAPKPALTELSFLGAAGRYGLYRVFPRTGRAHQIRRHLKHVSHPLIGDVRYGKGEHNRIFRKLYDLHRLALHCTSITLIHPRTSKSLVVRAPLPPDLSRVLSGLGFDGLDLDQLGLDELGLDELVEGSCSPKS